MLFLPYSTELKLNKIPYVTYAIILLCIIVFFLQSENRTTIDVAASNYCQYLSSNKVSKADAGVLKNKYNCRNILATIHIYYRDNETLEEYINRNLGNLPFSEREVSIIKKHYEQFSEDLVPSLDQGLMYYPDSWNPWKMITSSLSHGDIWHIAFNLIFFFAFTPALEILINNKIQFIKIILAITFATGITYSLANIGSNAVPTLGLSGVVMGMIGLAAYLMPQAKIRVFVWFIVIFKTFYIPAWILAIWYIGWDGWSLFAQGNGGGINLIAHVSGGVAGYLLGMKMFKERRDDYQYELDGAIDESRYHRKDTVFKVSSQSERDDFSNKLRIKTANREYEDNLSRVYEYVISDRDSEATVLLLDDDNVKYASVEIYEELFDRVSQWKPSRALLCMGRLIVHVLMVNHQYKRAIEYVQRCQKISKDFVLSSAEEMLLLTQNAIKLQQYELAYYLVTNADQRYNGKFDVVHCQFLEIEMLWRYLEQHMKAKKMMKELLKTRPQVHRDEIMQLALKMQKSIL